LKRGGLPVGTVVKVMRRDGDPLGYEGGALARLQMAIA
jgi:hypothetical protein